MRPILEVCYREVGYEGGGGHHEPWWRKTVAWKHLSATLEEIFVAARARRWESSRHEECGVGGKVENYDSGSEGPRYSGTDTNDTWVG